ncbi:MAG TPA: hypothetical protein VHV77_03195 [Pirellulales bacterium]|nr:hypothetical protein [Pirellulales bacterium]
MNVSLDPTAHTPSDPTSSNANAASNAQTATQQQSNARAAKSAETPATSTELTTASQTQSSSQPASTAHGEIAQANVTFRRDDAGQIYYVLTDADSGKEIREVPPAEIRKVGEGIAEYLKQEAAKGSATAHVKVKA